MRTVVLILLGAPAIVAAAANGREPLHKGSIDLPTGLYVRVNEDLVLQGSPRLALRRTYLSGYRTAREFGIGTTHSGEDYLVGGGEKFEWVSLMLARGTRMHFRRVTPGTSLLDARFVHDATAGEWQGAQLTSTLASWTLRKRDGSVLVFRGCEPGTMCSILQSTDAQGRTIHYRRNADGQLLKMHAGARWIAFDYDDNGRIVRAYDNRKRAVRYAYDRRGRLERVTGSDGTVRRYTYTDLDELETIEEPGTSVTNTYRAGRCVRQVNRVENEKPSVVDVKYEVDGRTVRRTRVTQPNGEWREYAWDDRKTAMSETLGRTGAAPVLVSYERDPVSRAVITLTVSCRGRDGRPVRELTTVKRGEEDLLKSALVQKYCF